MQNSRDITVLKLDHTGHEVWRYSGVVLDRGETWVQLEARFNRDDKPEDYVVFRRGDRFIEWFYSNRMYNIFEIHNVGDDHLKGWYCNVCRPAIITDHEVRCDDLALDVWVSPTGDVRVLDEDEFEAIELGAKDRGQALQAIEELRRLAQRRESPFDKIV